MQQASPYGLLLISGAQTHQENYAPAFAADPRCRLVGLTDESDIPSRRRELNRQLADELNIPVLENLEEALQRDDVHLVSVCAEPERRGRLAAQAARAGKHVYIDKPLCTTPTDADEILSAVKEAGVLSQMFSLVRIPAAQQARQIIESGQIGKLIGLHCEMLFAKGPGGTADLSQPRREKPEADRFTFIDSKRELFCVGLYPLVLFPWLTGERIVDVYGTTSNFFFQEHQRNDVEDFACLSLLTESGIDAGITVGRTGWASHPSHGIHQIHLTGTEGAVTIDAYRPRLEVYSDAPPWRPPEKPHPEDPMGFWSSTQKEAGIRTKADWFPIAQAAQSDASYFLDCLEQGKESDVPAHLGAQVLQVILSGYRSAAEGKPIKLT